MELRDYIAIRRAYNLERQGSPRKSRMTFSEFAMLCRIYVLDEPLATTEIAKYQNVLRPTMTHRTKHLAQMGLLERQKGDRDHRHILCSLTEAGEAFVEDTCEHLCDNLRMGTALKRIDRERACRYVDAMGSLDLRASDLVLLWRHEQRAGSYGQLARQHARPAPAHGLHVGVHAAENRYGQPRVRW